MKSIKADSLAVMEDAMTYFYRLALKERYRGGDADPKAIRDNLREAVTIAKEVAPYRHPRLSSVKVGSDRTNASYVPDGVTSAELREELFSMIARSGVLPTAMSKRLQRAEALLEHQGVVNGALTAMVINRSHRIRSIERFHFLVLPPGKVSPGGTVWHCGGCLVALRVGFECHEARAIRRTSSITDAA